ncbi:MFS transporter [Halopseudomonas pachastrellae]|nr:MFS transporter [Halopseudomonas pachastrellae]
MTALFGLMVFTLYPMAVALANDHVKPDDRVPLSAMLLVTFGLGASIGPLLSSAMMKLWGASMLYIFMAACSAILVFRVRADAVTGENLVEAAPCSSCRRPVTWPAHRWRQPLTRALMSRQ